MIFGSGIWKQLANISKGCRAKQRIGNGMQQYIRITVTDQRSIVRNLHATESQRTAWAQTMCVMSYANAQITRI